MVEDIDQYNRTTEMLRQLLPADNASMMLLKGVVSIPTKLISIMMLWKNPDLIQENKGRIVAFTPLSGILNQDKYLPIRYAPIQIELEVVSNAADAVNTSGSTSTNWNISDVQLQCDVISLDNHLDNEYAQHLLSGKALPINFSSYTTISQAVSGPDVTLNISRAVTRLKAVFVTMFSTATASEKEANLFYHSMGATAHDPDAEVEIQMQIANW